MRNRIKVITHITMNSGHVRTTKPDEISKDLYFIFRKLFKKSLTEQTEVFEGYTMKSTQALPAGTLITLYGKTPAGPAPIITVGITDNPDGVLWDALHDNASLPVITDRNKPPAAPYIADRLEIGSVLFPDAMEWTGDFSRCMGWIVLAPERVR